MNRFYHNHLATAAFILLPLFSWAQRSGSNNFAILFDGVSTARKDVVTLRHLRDSSGKELQDTMLFRFVPRDTVETEITNGNGKMAQVSGTFVAATEVTRAQWKAIMGGAGSEPGDDLPATGMKMGDVMTFVDRVTEISRHEVMLLDMESEEATTLRYTNDSVDHQGRCHIVTLPLWQHDPEHTAWLRGQRTHAVATLAPDRFGIYDLAGNARELHVTKKEGCYLLTLWGGSYNSDIQEQQVITWHPEKEPDLCLPTDTGIRLAYRERFFIPME